MMRVRRHADARRRDKRLDHEDVVAMAGGGDVDDAAAEVQGVAGGRPRPTAFPASAASAATSSSSAARSAWSLRVIPMQVRTIDELGLPPVSRRSRGRARPGSGHRHHRQRQEHHAGGDDRLHQHDPLGARHDDRGSDRVPPPRQAVDRQPARGGGGHHVVRAGAAQRAASGPRRHPRRRDARRRDDRDRRCSPPRPATWSSRRCTRSTPPRPSTASSRCFRRTSR